MRENVKKLLATHAATRTNSETRRFRCETKRHPYPECGPATLDQQAKATKPARLCAGVRPLKFAPQLPTGDCHRAKRRSSPREGSQFAVAPPEGVPERMRQSPTWRIVAPACKYCKPASAESMPPVARIGKSGRARAMAETPRRAMGRIAFPVEVRKDVCADQEAEQNILTTWRKTIPTTCAQIWVKIAYKLGTARSKRVRHTIQLLHSL